MLFVILSALYFLTYSGHEISNDELILFDGVHSLAQHGNLWMAYLNTERLPFTYANNAPVPSIDSEPMQVFAALPLFWIAQVMPGIGLMQTVWLLNIIITALTAVVLFYFGLTLGYSTRTAFIGGLLFGAATMAWPYSKTFFREPILTLCLMVGAYCIQRWQLAAARNYRIGWLTGAVLAVLGALAAKNAAGFLFPALIALIVPDGWRQLRLTRRQTLIGGFVIAAIGTSLYLAAHFAARGRYDPLILLGRIGQEAAQIPYALAGYLLSPGRSVWAYAPVLLLGFWGLALLRRQKRWREMTVPLLAVGVTALGYAILQNSEWYGGLAWGPRYLVPAVPFLALLLLPIIEALPRAPRLAQLAVGIVIALSIGIQLLGTLIPTNAYFAYLAAENARLGLAENTLNGWQTGTWDLRYLPFTVLPRIAASSGTDIAWQVNGAVGIAALSVGLIIVGGLVSIYPFRPKALTPQPSLPQGEGAPDARRVPRYNRQQWRVLGDMCLLIIGLVVVLSVGLYSYRADPRYGGNDPTLRSALDSLKATLRPGDAVLLNDRAYRPFFMNFYKSSVPIFLLPDAPGEVSEPGKPAAMVSTNLDALAAPILSMMLPRIAMFSTRWWFVTEFIPADSSRTRATEHYLTRHFFPIQEIVSTDRLRLVEFSPQNAPPDTTPPWNNAPLNVTFGSLFTLVSSQPTGSVTVKRGQPLALSLVWRPAANVSFDYSLNVSLVDSHNGVVPGVQRSGTPLGTFGLTSQWQLGGYYRDNHALLIPSDLAPGLYHVWLVWYDWRDNSRLPVNGADHYELLAVTVE